VSDTLELARRARDRAGGDVLVTVVRERSTMLRFARSRPTQATSLDDLAVEIAALRGGHVGRASTSRVDDEGLEDCARTAIAAAESAAATGEGCYPGFPSPAAPRQHHGHDPSTAELDAAVGGAALADAFAATDAYGAAANGTWTAGEVETAIASSTGVEVRDRVTDAFMKVIAVTPTGRSGYASRTSVSIEDIDPSALAERAAGKAAAAGETAVLAPGEYTVVMEPHAVRELLLILGRCAFDGLLHAEGRGALTGKLGTRVVSPAINLSDSPRYPGTLPRAFDAEGTPKSPLPLIQDGVAHRVTHDTASAAIAGGSAETTGHALAAGGRAEGPQPTNLVLVGGGAADEEELCRPVERGIYVTRLWYSNVLNPTDSTFTAMTRDGTFSIEDGQVGPPIEDMRLTDTALGVLARVEALGARPLLSSDGELYGRRFAIGVVCPPLRAHDVCFVD
jgi:PmbA protein